MKMNRVVSGMACLALVMLLVVASGVLVDAAPISNAGIGVIEKPGDYTPRAGAYALAGSATESSSMNGQSFLQLSQGTYNLSIYLGGTYSVTTVDIWNYNEAADLTRSTQNYSIQASTDGVTFSTIYSGSLTQGTGDATNPKQSPAFTAADASIMRIVGTSSYGGVDFGLNRVQISGSGTETPQIASAGISVTDFSSANNVSVNGPSKTLDGSIATDNASRWLTDSPDPNAYVTYDLGGSYDLEALKIWNNSEGGRNFQTLQVLTSADGSVFTALTNPLTATTTFTLEDNLVTYGFEPSILYLGNDVTTRYVQLYQLTGGDGSEYTGLTEVEFFGAVHIPEPASFALFALAGLAALRRRRG